MKIKRVSNDAKVKKPVATALQTPLGFVLCNKFGQESIFRGPVWKVLMSDLLFA